MINKYLYFFAGAHMSLDICPGALPGILPFFVSEYGMDYTSITGLMFASSFLASVSQPFFGWLADRTSKHWFMGTGVLVSGLSLAAVGFMHNYWAIFISVMLMGIGSSIFHPEAARFVNAISGTRRGSAMGIFSIGGNAGFGLGPLLAVALLSYFGMKGTAFFGIIGIIMSIALFIWTPRIIAASEKMMVTATGRSAAELKIKTMAQTSTAKAAKSGLPESESASTMAAASEASATTAAAKMTAPAAAASEPQNDWSGFRRLTLVIVCRSIVNNSLNSFLPLFCITALMTSKAVGSSALSLLSICGIAATLIGGFLSDRWGYIKVLHYGCLLLVPVMAAVVFSYNIGVILAMMIPLSLALNGTYSSFVVLGQSYLAKSIGFASGVTLGLNVTIGGVVSPFLGMFADHYGLPAVMTLVLVISFLCALSTFFLREPKKI